MTIQWRIKGYTASSEGWSAALDLKEPMLSDWHTIESYALDVVGTSNDWQYFTFTPKESSNLWDVNDFKARTVPMMATFHFRGDPDSMKYDIELVKNANNYYYKQPVGALSSCFVDRFDCYPRLP